ncbi:MAG: hypothetical protein ACRBFS_10670 [Aureispira sp.]
MKTYLHQNSRKKHNFYMATFFVIAMVVAIAITSIKSANKIPTLAELEGMGYRGENKLLFDSTAFSVPFELAPLKEEHLYNLVESYMESGEIGEALAYLKAEEPMQRDSSSYVGFMNYAALVHLRARDTLGAVTLYQKLVDFAPHTGRFSNQLGVLYTYTASYDRAIGAFQAAIKKEVNNALYHYNLGIAYQKIRKRRRALKALKKARLLGHLGACTLYRKMTRKEVYRAGKTVCCDGTLSTSTGRGTCSHHGGICETATVVDTIYTVAACQ